MMYAMWLLDFAPWLLWKVGQVSFWLTLSFGPALFFRHVNGGEWMH